MLLSVLFDSLTARAPFCCVHFTETIEDEETRSSVRFPNLHLFFVELDASMFSF